VSVSQPLMMISRPTSRRSHPDSPPPNHLRSNPLDLYEPIWIDVPPPPCPSAMHSKGRHQTYNLPRSPYLDTDISAPFYPQSTGQLEQARERRWWRRPATRKIISVVLAVGLVWGIAVGATRFVMKRNRAASVEAMTVTNGV
jgi:hypothetical protein